MRVLQNPKCSDRGFAIIVTISLMVLLSLLAVGLLGLSSVALRSSGQSSARGVAEANARLALMMAIAELQRELGPDSRISAPQDVGGASGGSANWTAVYDAWGREGAGAPLSPESRGEPKFRGWLVSGANGGVGGPEGTNERISMVGSGSLGGGSNPERLVEVPMFEINDSTNRGRVAWWVSDEGTKAKINAGPDQADEATFGLSDSLFDSQSPPHPNHRVFPPLAGFDWADGQRGKTISSATLPLATGVAQGELNEFTHDYTLHSAGVLADVRAGRLKRDLSNLLARPVSEVEDKPLYLANGVMNQFVIGEDGGISNMAGVPSGWRSAKDGPSQWGINLEELHLFHSLPNHLTWSGGSPSLSMERTREGAVADRHYIYKRPSTQALQFIFSLQAVPDSRQGKYKMVMKMDAMVAVGNPNDLPLVIPPGLDLEYQLSLVPYDLNWNIERARGGAVTSKTTAPVLKLFKGNLAGRGASRSAGFTLDPGEAAVFGSSTARGFDLDLQRGFVPGGGVEVTSWDLKASNLNADDKVDFEFTRIPTQHRYGWMQFNAWIGGRKARQGWQSDRITLKGGDLSGGLIDESLPPSIVPPQVRPVSDFIAKAQPVLLLSFLQNVEQSSNGQTPDAFASRPFQLGESPISDRSFNPSTLEEDRHVGQGLVTAEPMNYQFRTLAAGDRGRNIYIGGGRQPNLGGSFNVVNRRIPIAPPLSIGAFQNAIASGFCGRFNDAGSAVGGDSFPSSAVALCGKPFATPLVTHAIGGSHGIPQLGPDEVFSNRPPGSQIDVATDHSWMVNSALWDAWFLSGIVDGSGQSSSGWMKDRRSPREQFMDLAEGEKPLRNKRFVFHASKSPDEAATELFSGSEFKDSAINQLPKYLLVDGAFNVNSTSVEAWAAVLGSVRDQQLISATGSPKSFDHPFGTLGHAVSDATDGSEGDWMGLRDLSEAQIRSLAESLVSEVRERGPFLSLADFVNRRPDSDKPEHQALGALQAAINQAGLNDRHASGNRAASPGDFAGFDGAELIAAEVAPSRAVGSRGYLSQADLLTAIGSQIAVRSDSFVIRTYGDALDASGNVLSRVWCEAVVQRLPEYVSSEDEPDAANGWPGASDKLSDVNSKFGRRFVINSFRWLSPEEV